MTFAIIMLCLLVLAWIAVTNVADCLEKYWRKQPWNGDLQ